MLCLPLSFSSITSHIPPVFIISLPLVTSVSTVLCLLSQRRARQEAAAPQGPIAPRVPATWFPALQAPSAPQKVTDNTE